MQSLKVGIIGYGTIGTGVARILLNERELLSKRCGRDVELHTLAELNLQQKPDIDLSSVKLVKDAGLLLDDDQVDIIVEVVGGVSPAKEFIEKALKRRKHVVTANKELIAKHGAELFSLARENKVCLLCEASSGGGIPIIQALTSALVANRFQKIYGILNGTTNYILTKMHEEGADFTSVLKEAQKLGYAEADPSSDVDGHDVAYKLSILGCFAFDSYFDTAKIYREGIRSISHRDIELACEFGYVIKLLAIGVAIDDDNVELRVHPVMLPREHPLAAVSGSFNAVYVEGNSVGETMFYGRGAGELPTASAIVGDIVHIARYACPDGDAFPLQFGTGKKKTLVSIGEIVSQYYLRLIVRDSAGVLASISRVFGDNAVSIHVVHQKDSLGEDAELVIMTHAVKEAQMLKAIQEIKDLDIVTEVCSLIRTDL